jgi:hypothetical protein
MATSGKNVSTFNGDYLPTRKGHFGKNLEMRKEIHRRPKTPGQEFSDNYRGF